MARLSVSLIFRFALGAGIGSALLFGGTSAARTSNIGSAATPAIDTQPIVCFMDRVATTTTVPKQVGGVAVVVSVTVDPVTRVRVDGGGRVASVGTNSGCPPKSSDQFVVDSGAGFDRAPAGVVAAALACRTTDSWEETADWHICH